MAQFAGFCDLHPATLTIPESPQQPITDRAANRAKKQRLEMESCPAFAKVGLEMRKLVISTCRNIVHIEVNLDKLHQRSVLLEEHKSKGTIPKDLLLPKKRALYEDGQTSVDEIIQNAQALLLQLRITETGRKIRELHSKKHDLENKILSTLNASREAQFKALSEQDESSLSSIEERHT